MRAAVATLALVTTLGGAACSDGPGRPDRLAEDDDRPNPGPPPTLPGGVELPALDPATVLTGAELAFGTPLPSEQAAADGFTVTPEVTSALARRVFSVPDGRRLGDAVVLVLDGAEVFDDGGLAAFVRGIVEAMGGAPVEDDELAGRGVVRSTGPAQTAIGFREGNLLAVAVSAVDADVRFVVTRQVEALARGEAGRADPVTPLVAVAPGAAFVPMATVSFEVIPPPEEEADPPEAPALPGAAAVEGRYGVVAGERRTVVWSFSVDLGAYPTAEALAPALGPLVASRADGVAPTASEVVDRVVLAATNPEGEPSARVFRHQGLVLVVEGDRPDQLDAVVTAWITALGPG